jgi:hypothetical protein
VNSLLHAAQYAGLLKASINKPGITTTDNVARLIGKGMFKGDNKFEKG